MLGSESHCLVEGCFQQWKKKEEWKGRELMNEGGYKNRKPKGEGGEVSRRK